MIECSLSSVSLARDLKRIEQKLMYHRKEQRQLECLAARIDHILRERAQRAILILELHPDDYIVFIAE